MSKNGHDEIVYYSDGTINNTDEDRGTYNYYDYDKDPVKHAIADILPWVLWGNSKDDKTTSEDRIKSLFK